MDLVIANEYGDTVSVLYNFGNGTFATQMTYSVGDGPISVTTADIDGDGTKDIITANYHDSTISILRNFKNNFQPTPNADFSGDGLVSLLDLCILSHNWGTTTGATKSTGDANGDGAVSLIDLDILGRSWGMGAMELQSPTPQAQLLIDATTQNTIPPSFHTLENLFADDEETTPLQLF